MGQEKLVFLLNCSLIVAFIYWMDRRKKARTLRVGDHVFWAGIKQVTKIERDE